MNITKILDLKEMPDFNWETQKNRGSWSTQDVSDGNVFLDSRDKPVCIDHGSMNCVTETKEIWRCIACGRACFAILQDISWRYRFIDYQTP